MQAAAFMALGDRRRRKERARNLSIAATAARAKVEDINRKINKDWDD